VLVLIKGADSALKPLLEKATPQDEWDKTVDLMGEMGADSLRTLMVGYSLKDAAWFEKLKGPYDEALRKQGDAEKGHVEGSCSKSCKICAAETKVEEAAEFKLLGATGQQRQHSNHHRVQTRGIRSCADLLHLIFSSAIEDELAPNVPRALAHLLRAGLKVWVLTGDTGLCSAAFPQ
jgi:magnesium-transporting ATPase (P-type)